MDFGFEEEERVRKPKDDFFSVASASIKGETAIDAYIAQNIHESAEEDNMENKFKNLKCSDLSSFS